MDNANRPSFMMSGAYAPSRPGANTAIANPRQVAAEGRRDAMNRANEDAAQALRNMLVRSDVVTVTSAFTLLFT